ncbi:hypothetical protein VTN31DRAFT_6982 [Thermomyces dupontii]|uniref:uncharacterized protein n=1 Tax=Talaromyces thermophilus TaxID=28565 RepID=UPI0037445486
MASPQFNIPCPLLSRALPIILGKTEHLTSYSKKFRLQKSSSATGDKKRNKLGYQRTSAACVHCRRRKIRCLLAADDAQGRCESCIRLKRECVFLSADQRALAEKKRLAESKLNLTQSVSSTTSSPPSMTSTSIDSPNLDRTRQNEIPDLAELDLTPFASSTSLSGSTAGVTQPRYELIPRFDSIAAGDNAVMLAPTNPKATQTVCTQSDSGFASPMTFAEHMSDNPHMLTPPETSQQVQPDGLIWQMQSQRTVNPSTES